MILVAHDCYDAMTTPEYIASAYIHTHMHTTDIIIMAFNTIICTLQSRYHGYHHIPLSLFYQEGVPRYVVITLFCYCGEHVILLAKANACCHMYCVDL